MMQIRLKLCSLPFWLGLTALVSLTACTGQSRFSGSLFSIFGTNNAASVSTGPAPTPTHLVASLQLPIEVTYPVGSSKTINLSASDAVTTLQLSLHGLELENEVSISINGGAPVLITNANVTLLGPGLARYFLIGGSENSYYNLTLPVKIAAGKVAITFTLNQISERLSGFRVVKLALLNAAGQDVNEMTLAAEDPTQWTAPLVAGHVATAGDVSGGQYLFAQEPLINSPMNKNQMKMHCSDCHSSNASDLKYFNFSNDSIIARALFHGLTATQGQQIAAYVRTLPTYQSVKARPWNPPFQPAPNVDASSAQEWAAGGGIDSVLNNDIDMLNYLIPTYASQGVSAITPNIFLNPANPNSVSSLRVFQNFNMRTLPQPIPFLDWNHWLTPLSIRDLAGSDDNYENSLLVSQFNKTLQQAQTIQAENLNDGGAALASSIHNNWEYEINAPGAYKLPFLPASIYPPTNYTANQIIKANYDMRLWTMVKSWQFQNDFNLNDKTHLVYDPIMAGLQKIGQQSTNIDVNSLIEPRGWVFNSASFLTSPHGIDPTNLITASYPGDILIHESWYYMQLILNPGMGVNGGNSNIDFGYFNGTTLGSDGAKTALYTGPTLSSAISDATLQYPFTQVMPYPIVKDMILTLKAWNERDGGLSVTSGGDLGWAPSRLGQEMNFSATAAGTSLNSRVPADVPMSVAQALLTAVNHAWFMKSKSFPNQDYYNGYSNLSTDTINLNKFFTAKIDANATLASVSNQANVCNFNAAVFAVDDQICQMNRGGYWPDLIVSGSAPYGGLGSPLVGMVTWRGGVLQQPSKEILDWVSQMFPQIDIYGQANQGVPYCAANLNDISNLYACAGTGGALATPMPK